MYEDFKLLNTNIEKSVILMNDLEFMNNNINSKENRLHIFIKRRKLKKMSKKLENLTCIILQELNTFKKSLEK
ncbi:MULTISPECIES: hypothetical protein [Aliarcobacter]|jgi:hypothetical protein|uniref:Uncharacterized protein n=1 Tax=Arcobacter sp. AZ-2023 TaxID=3074453 RepID=A0AA96DKC0_9BACT|nr:MULTISPECIES: hypothetical protein [Aliarcobacter]WNL29529.1 hypothetical protein RMQ68_09185 [Arcobacter sp. AZ-2023]MCG3677509.1 hypothetical protein [Aliarcobacter butzleri]MCG3709497.1 hypothetical protein [Aliarcobacter butzleri]MCT7571405.1 hypothetical protein [Aliarcobacter butzleri]MCT7591378.1 hypothetical protein [Aliarcobacter butzleri]